MCSKRTEEEEGNKMEERPNWTRYLVCVGREGREAEMAHRVRDLCTGQKEGRTGTDIKISGRKEGRGTCSIAMQV